MLKGNHSQQVPTQTSFPKKCILFLHWRTALPRFLSFTPCYLIEMFNTIGNFSKISTRDLNQHVLNLCFKVKMTQVPYGWKPPTPKN